MQTDAINLYPPIENAVFLTGPTAGGKTRLGVRLAQRIDAEIISLDSMAIYRRMNIGTAKPTLEEREGVPHHLIDVAEPWEEYSLAQYLKAAHQIAEEIHARGKRVLFVGGTPLYLKGALRGIFEGPPADLALRAELEKREAAGGPGALHRELAQCDPEAAERLHPNDTRRLVRALEVFYKTGRPISSFQKQFDAPPPHSGNRVFVLAWPREVIYDRINRRVDLMMKEGFLDEVKNLLALDKPLSRTAQQGVGYTELINVLQNGADLSAAIDRIKQLTRNFAKRQGTWFRSFAEAVSVPMSEPVENGRLAEEIAAQLDA